MTTNQTIDGVPRDQMICFPRELSDDLGELIANKARVCGGGAFEIWEAICEQFGTPASQPAPVAVVLPERREIGPNYPYLSDLDIEWNDCLDEVTRLNTK